MARPLRIEYGGALYHVTSRGDRQEPIYEDDEDRRSFLTVLGDVAERFGWVCYAYCLMGNHYHLVIETPKGNLSKGMRQLNGVFTQVSNRRHGKVGHVFQGRYKAILIEKDAYWLEVSRYVVLNPVRAGMVKEAGRWKWSSYNATVGVESVPGWLAVEGLLMQFNDKQSVAKRQYRSFVNEGIGRESVWEELKQQIYLGSDRFIGRMQRKLEEGKAKDVNIPRAQRQSPAPSLKAIEARSRDRKKVMVVAYETGAYSYQQIAKHFGVHFTTVGRVVRGTKKKGEDSTSQGIAHLQ
jgi:putative transposase